MERSDFWHNSCSFKFTMPRGPRHLPEAGMFHLIARGNNGVCICRNREDFSHLKRTILRFTPNTEVAVHHYALMHTHFHLLAWVEDTNVLASVMKALLVSYQLYYRRKYPYNGHLWHSRFRSILMKDEAQWLQCARYIELNPVYAGICQDPKEYRWTSYHHYTFGKSDSFIRTKLHLSGMNTWKQFVLAGIDLDYQKLKRELEQERFLKK